LHITGRDIVARSAEQCHPCEAEPCGTGVPHRRLTLEDFSRAVRPTLFDVAAQPALLVAQTYANLMSPAAWEIKARIDKRISATASERRERANVYMEEIHEYVNRKFYHASQRGTVGIWGVLDLEEERRRLSPQLVDYALGLIMRTLEDRRDRGILRPGQNIFHLVEKGAFPAYEYSTVDILEALGRIRKRKHRPLGVSACGDEAALIYALACLDAGTDLSQIAILGSPFHYTVFVQHEERGHWFNGKREYHNDETWSQLTSGQSPAKIQNEFNSRIGNLDRVISVHGVHSLNTNECTIPKEKLTKLHNSLSAFFGIEVRQIGEAKKAGVSWKRNSILEAPPLDLSNTESPQDVENNVRRMAKQYPESVYALALYSFRSAHVDLPEAYLRVALRGERTKKRAARIRCIDDAIEATRGITGRESVLGTTERIAMPNEVLRFDTGTHLEKAFLLFSLMHNANDIPSEEKKNMQILAGSGTSYIKAGGRLIETSRFTELDHIDKPVTAMGPL